MSKRKSNYKKKGNIIKDLTRKILQLLNRDGNPLNYKQIAAKLAISDANGRNQIIQKLEELKGQQKVEEVERGKFKVVPKDKYYIGVLDVTSNGNAYFICDELEKDIYIPSRNLNKGLDKDTVKIYLYNRRNSKKEEGDVVEIIKRAKTEFVGVLQLNKNFGFLIADDLKMYADLFIPKDKLKGAEDGVKVLAKMTDWPGNSKNPFGEIIEILGKPGDHETEMHSILLEYGLPYKFPDKVEAEAEKISFKITEEDIAKRRDMRKDLTFTIDPKDAKDFDDALSFEVLENGNYEIGIHIADVSHYVQENTILEDEAYQRATSVYLVDRVVPMLPEVLSNGVCSLRPNEEKLTFSAVFEMNDKGHVLNQWFGRTITYSDKRFAYEEAQEIIENNTITSGAIDTASLNCKVSSEISITGEAYTVKPEIATAILTLDKLAKKIRKKRLQQGAITFDRVEVKFNLNEKAEPIGVFFKESKDANKLIEEFMLLANRKVAEFVGTKKGAPSKNTFIYRIHDEPDEEKLLSLQSIVSKFGYKNKIDLKNNKTTSSSINQLLQDVHGKGEANMIETLAVRSMSKAVYTTDNIGHYGLAFDYYSHFTSPIRRYPDVMTHRLLQHYLEGGKSPKAAPYEEKCKHASEREYMASKAERDSIKYMQVKYMEDHKDQEFEGVISGVTEWGIYVEIIENKCEGMIRIRDIKDDYYLYDEKQYALVGQATKNLYQLGDQVLIKVKNTDLERKHLDFTLLEKIEK
ncbi:VacB/RNase II family 3'-5' exoribonuclease [Lutibacter sp. A64]|uniref:ribonuclease R family protein n=1 Tax=Lutibacter sp. A64 TaxID=2918526 RepID=UPI001F058D9C|nr:VacB/RNase II family 3'-5' exoribonuclease [Lutibacter sp. A64]UMB53029.1 VacB/RNase II family 3'-5' exoribonuclease [Lutibacter sp. A64]